MKLIAKERFYYGGRNVEQGQEFEADAQDVPLLTNSVSPRARVAPKEQPKAAPQAAEKPKRRYYQRRDMRAKE